MRVKGRDTTALAEFGKVNNGVSGIWSDFVGEASSQSWALSLVSDPSSLIAGCTASGYLPTSLAWHPQQSEVFVFGKAACPIAFDSGKGEDESTLTL